MKLILLIPLILVCQACQTSGFKRNEVTALTAKRECHEILGQADWDDETQLLAITESLYRNECYDESLRLGGLLRDRLRDKSYSVISEFFSILGPEELSQAYVLESHERVYLNLLMSLSHLQLGHKQEARIDLKKATEELDAVLYNHGRDRVSALLIASLWQDFDEPDMAAPFWKRLGYTAPSGEKLKIYRLGKLSGYNWSLGQSPSSGFYSIAAHEELPEACVSKTGVLMPVHDWTQKMNLRHTEDYHPLLNYKTYVRLPIALGYGVLLGGTGLAVAVGGCIAANDNKDACEGAIELGGWMMSKAPDVVSYTAKPDLRHWAESPLAFLVTGANSLSEEACIPDLPTARLK